MQGVYLPGLAESMSCICFANLCIIVCPNRNEPPVLCRTPGLYTSSSIYNYLLCKPIRMNRTALPNLASLQIDPSYYNFQVKSFNEFREMSCTSTRSENLLSILSTKFILSLKVRKQRVSPRRKNRNQSADQDWQHRLHGQELNNKLLQGALCFANSVLLLSLLGHRSDIAIFWSFKSWDSNYTAGLCLHDWIHSTDIQSWSINRKACMCVLSIQPRHAQDSYHRQCVGGVRGGSHYSSCDGLFLALASSVSSFLTTKGQKKGSSRTRKECLVGSYRRRRFHRTVGMESGSNGSRHKGPWQSYEKQTHRISRLWGVYRGRLFCYCLPWACRCSGLVYHHAAGTRNFQWLNSPLNLNSSILIGRLEHLENVWTIENIDSTTLPVILFTWHETPLAWQLTQREMFLHTTLFGVLCPLFPLSA